MQDVTEGTTQKRDRLAVLVWIEGKYYLLGILALEKGTALIQSQTIVNLLDEYKLTDKVIGLCFDTTAVNTGHISGTNIRISKNKDTALLQLACCQHMYELHIKHFYRED